MRPLTRIALSLAWPIAALAGLAVFADEAAILHVNPFKRPISESARSLGRTDATNALDTAPEPPPAPLILEATVIGPNRPLARINGTILAPGDSVDGYRVTGIRPGVAMLTKSGQTVTLYLEQKSSSKGQEHGQAPTRQSR